jgi:hypothetical protein
VSFLNGTIFNSVERRCAPTERRWQISGVLKTTAHELSIEVNNPLVNQLIGDRQPTETGQEIFAPAKPHGLPG